MKVVKIIMIFCGVVVLGSSSALASITPVVDGRFETSDGYSLGLLVTLEVEGGKKSGNVSADNGVLWLYQDPATSDLFVNFTLPLTLVDNSYGDNAIGWGDAAPSGKNHNFKDFKGSDGARFTITDGAGNVVFDFTLDYISASGDVPSGFSSLGIGGNGDVYAGSAASLLAWGTSLDYNFNALGHVLTEDSPATDENYTENPNLPGWVFEVTYEFQIDGSLFADNGFGGLTIPIVHSSPNKIAKNKVFGTVATTTTVPEPAAVALLGLGSLVLLCKRCADKKKRGGSAR